VTGRRLLVLLVVLAAIGVPAGVLRATCALNSCSRTGGEPPRVPFCPLPEALKDDLVHGFREGRSPDVMAVPAATSVLGGTDPADAFVEWPFVRAAETTGVPIVFAGTGVDAAAEVDVGVALDRIAPTVAEIIGLDRPFPRVRSGLSLTGVANGERPRLVLEVALDRVGSVDVRTDDAWSYLRALLRRGAGTLDGTTGSLPLSATATLTTIGTGGLPFQHGITGTLIRGDDGEIVRAWSPDAPPSVIASLADDLDERTDQRAMIGLVAAGTEDRGLIGDNWYPTHDTDDVVTARAGRTLDAATALLATGYGADDVPDLLGVVLEPGDAEALRGLVEAAERASGGSVLVVVAGTGSNGLNPGGLDVPAADVLAQVEQDVPGSRPVVAAAVPGGLFLDPATLTAEGITGQAVVDALLDVRSPGGERMMADAFQGFAVSFARYC
jgi:hypothetical protein